MKDKKSQDCRSESWEAEVMIQSKMQGLRIDGGRHAAGKFQSESEILSTGVTMTKAEIQWHPRSRRGCRFPLLPPCPTHVFSGLGDGHTHYKCYLYSMYTLMSSDMTTQEPCFPCNLGIFNPIKIDVQISDHVNIALNCLGNSPCTFAHTNYSDAYFYLSIYLAEQWQF